MQIKCSQASFLADAADLANHISVRRVTLAVNLAYLLLTHIKSDKLLLYRPNYRHKGVASLAMKWGIQKSEELGLDAFVESTEDGRGLYEAHGFKVFDDFYLDATTDSPNQECIQKRKELQLPIYGYYMKRPVDAKKST